MVVQTIPTGTIPKNPDLISKGILNIETGHYEFNDLIDFMPMAPTSLYLMESLTVIANIGDKDYYNSIVVIPNLDFILKTTGDKLQMFPDSVSVDSVGSQSLLSGWFWANGADTLQIGIKGELQQVVETIDLETIDLRISANIQRVMNREFIKRFHLTESI